MLCCLHFVLPGKVSGQQTPAQGWLVVCLLQIFIIQRVNFGLYGDLYLWLLSTWISGTMNRSSQKFCEMGDSFPPPYPWWTEVNRVRPSSLTNSHSGSAAKLVTQCHWCLSEHHNVRATSSGKIIFSLIQGSSLSGKTMRLPHRQSLLDSSLPAEKRWAVLWTRCCFHKL